MKTVIKRLTMVKEWESVEEIKSEKVQDGEKQVIEVERNNEWNQIKFTVF